MVAIANVLYNFIIVIRYQISVFVIEREWAKAGYFAAAGAVMSFFGLMHGPAVGFAVTPGVALAYALLAGGLFAVGRVPVMAMKPAKKAPPASWREGRSRRS